MSRAGRSADACGAPRLGGGAGRRVLAVDVGAGTTDLLVTQPGEPLENAVKLVVPSRTQVVAAQIAAATAERRPVLFTGPLMGGGASGAAMKVHRRAGLAFTATAQAALTFADDLEKVRSLGVRVIDDAAAAELRSATAAGELAEVRAADLDVDGLRTALGRLGVESRFDAVAVAVQDHGFSPEGSNRAARFAYWEQAVRERRRIAQLFWPTSCVPARFTRLRAAADLAADLAAGGPTVVADTGPAALYGALPPGDRDAVLVNVGNGHVICVVALDDRLHGVFEHHTIRLDGAGLEQRLRAFLRGELTDEAVRRDGGHGAVLAAGGDLLARGDDLDGVSLIVTGPRRALLADSALPLRFAAPHGDMMLTGCFGLLRALEEIAPA